MDCEDLGYILRECSGFSVCSARLTAENSANFSLSRFKAEERTPDHCT